MSNIIKFQRPAASSKSGTNDETANRKKAGKDRDQIDQRIAALGGEAIESLRRWRRGLPMDDRIRLARNMDILFREFKVKPGKLDWGHHGYQDKESFNRDISRMRLPELAEPGRRLMAHNTRWLHLLEMVHRYCTDAGERVTLEALAERLTRGTQFHPTKKLHSRAEKLLYSLKLWANEIDQRYGLLKIYRQIAEARAEHFNLYMRDYGQESPAILDYGNAMESPINNFINIPENSLSLFQRELGSYTDNDWEEFLALIPEEYREDYRWKRGEVELWNANFNPKTTLFSGCTGMGTPALCRIEDVGYLPRWFIGFYDSHKLKLLSRYSEALEWPTKFSHKLGTVDPIYDKFSEDQGYFAYLTLYPNPEMSRIVPYLFSFTYDPYGTFTRLQEDTLTSEYEELFPPAGPETEAVAKPMQNRIEEDYPLLKEHWINTANSLKNHPLLTWSKSRELMIDTEIEQLTTGAGLSDE